MTLIFTAESCLFAVKLSLNWSITYLIFESLVANVTANMTDTILFSAVTGIVPAKLDVKLSKLWVS